MSTMSKALLAILAGLAGFAIVYFSNISLKPDYGAYLSIAALAGLDAVIGGVRAAQEGKFKNKVFISGFLVTVVLAVLLTWFGERIGVEIGLATVFVFVYRIMQNLGIIRTLWLDRESLHLPHLPAWPNHRRSQHAAAHPTEESEEARPAKTRVSSQ
ncbi:MAG TPA: small basic family protein [Capsulimonadaceae bacterium]|nr:small basic family protein [Capsulimonadaceae bacterium]